MTFPAGLLTASSAQPPGIGEIVSLCSCVIGLDVEALSTPPDVPDQYSARLNVMSDLGDMDLDAIRGAPGANGQALFALRDAVRFGYDPINDPGHLPTLTDAAQDIGLYWLIDQLDDQGHVLTQWCYIWWGSFYRQIMMGTVGEPGPVPRVDPLVTLIPPDQDGYVLPTGSSLAPTWEFFVPSPHGSPGVISPLYGFPDVDEVTTPPVTNNVLAFLGDYTDDGLPLWVPFDIEALSMRTYSMPESAFISFDGFSQQAPIGSFEIPAQPFPWTPVVWGHIGSHGINLSFNPFMIGCQVLLGDPVTGAQVARGLGNTMAVVNIMPHYSSIKQPNAGITPTNINKVIPAGVSGTASTLYVNLWNDGKLGDYSFAPGDAQLFVMVVPMEEATT